MIKYIHLPDPPPFFSLISHGIFPFLLSLSKQVELLLLEVPSQECTTSIEPTLRPSLSLESFPFFAVGHDFNFASASQTDIP